MEKYGVDKTMWSEDVADEFEYDDQSVKMSKVRSVIELSKR